jgi:hypothetical protein
MVRSNSPLNASYVFLAGPLYLGQDSSSLLKNTTQLQL